MILTPDKVQVLQSAVYRVCDGLDGVVDGLIADPRACTFDPASIACPAGADAPDCLTAAQVDVARKFYEGPRDSAGKRLFRGGLSLGSEPFWARWRIGSNGSLSFLGAAASEFLKYAGFKDPPGSSYDLFSFNLDRDPARLDANGALTDAIDPDLRAFKAHGGKLLFYEGWGDVVFPPTALIDYYEQASRAVDTGDLSQTQQYARLFLVPGMDHCRGGVGPAPTVSGMSTAVDVIPLLENWVERGQAPESVTLSQSGDDGVSRTRPVYPYPLVARYDGGGDVNDAASFAAVESPRSAIIQDR